MEQLFKELNIDGFMAKPFEMDVFCEEVDTIIKKTSGLVKRISTMQGDGPRKVCIAESSTELFNKIGLAFLNAGYVVNPARTGTDAVERICAAVPDVALINLGLTDIPGDIVILKLKKMAKAQAVKFILYTAKTAEEATIAEKIGKKEGVDRFVVYTDAQQLVEVVNELLNV
jgi:DNA-binding NtrC family response regulator